ncbi:MAG: hypothetical protein RR989_07465 [Ruthenibacterium sp.]
MLRNPKNVRFMSMFDLAEEWHVGLTGVFRFCKMMQLHGYQKFKMQLSLSMNSNEAKEESEVLPSDVKWRDSVEEAAKKLLHSSMCLIYFIQRYIAKNLNIPIKSIKRFPPRYWIRFIKKDGMHEYHCLYQTSSRHKRCTG